jgi:hypothetical protein
MSDSEYYITVGLYNKLTKCEKNHQIFGLEVSAIQK